MSTIDTQNAKKVRDQMQVHCSLTTRSKSIDMSVMRSGNVCIEDDNISESIDSETWSMRKLTDLSGEGFLLNGSCELYDDDKLASASKGKVGIRSYVGEGMTIRVTSTKDIPAVTLGITKGSGSIVVGSETYEISRVVILPVNGKSVTMKFVNDSPSERIEIASVTPGITLKITNENLVSCNVSLRSDLSIESPSWGISDIEVSAYWPDDISNVISHINDDVPLYYYAGYPGDYSQKRKFYISEPVTQEDNVITLRAEDESRKLEDSKPVALQRFDASKGESKRKIYHLLKNTIQNCGINLDYAQNSPDTNTNSDEQSVILTEQSPREYVQDIINLSHSGTFWPTFVDAGCPELYWSKPSTSNRNGRYPVWTIKEADCAEVTRTTERQVTRIRSDDEDYGLMSAVIRLDIWEKLTGELKIKKGKKVVKKFSDSYYWAYKVANKQKTVYNRLNAFSWVPSKTSTQKEVKVRVPGPIKKGDKEFKKVKKWFYKPILYGKELEVVKIAQSIRESGSRPGQTITTKPLVYGQALQGTAVIYPNYESLFDRSNITGAFRFRGDPRMQPRDIFKLVRKDKDANGNTVTETCTIETITLVHEKGGTYADITYRKGIV